MLWNAIRRGSGVIYLYQWAAFTWPEMLFSLCGDCNSEIQCSVTSYYPAKTYSRSLEAYANIWDYSVRPSLAHTMPLITYAH